MPTPPYEQARGGGFSITGGLSRLRRYGPDAIGSVPKDQKAAAAPASFFYAHPSLRASSWRVGIKKVRTHVRTFLSLLPHEDSNLD